MAGFNHPAFLKFLKEVRQQPSFPVYQRVGARLSREHEVATQLAGHRQVRLAILSSFTIDPIKPYLQIGCLERDIWADIFLPGFGQFAQQILDPKSQLYRFKPDVCFLHVLPDAVAPPHSTAGERSASIRRELILNAIKRWVEAFRQESTADLVVFNFADPGRFPYSLKRSQVSQELSVLNSQLQQMIERIPGAYLIDYERLTSYHGKAVVSDERLRHIARMELSDSFLPRLANQMLAFIVALRGFGRRCIVLDLDHTLWGGVVGEDGLKGIQLGPEYPGSAFVEFQQALLELKQQGILLAINSRNNESEVLEVLDRHPHRVLRWNDFSAIRINWGNKCENIVEIARQLNLGLESMVFIDDNPVEREQMRFLHSEVLTPEWPRDPVLYRHALESLCDFERVSLTAEDLLRNEMMAAEGKRGEWRKRTGSLEEFLMSLKMELWIQQADAGDLPRVHQLVQKTNQFNLTARRYSYSQIEQMHQRADAAIYTLRNRDAFGDNGLVGVAILLRERENPSGSPWRIDSFLMSCRVLGRTMEVGFLRCLLLELKGRGIRSMVGEYIPAVKNALVRNFYTEMGFQPMTGPDGVSRWILDLTRYLPPMLPWLSIHPLGSVPSREQEPSTADITLES